LRSGEGGGIAEKNVTAEPKHGEKWQAISKSVENSHLPIEALQKKDVVVCLL
jgi:pre-mRNA-processing factor 6